VLSTAPSSPKKLDRNPLQDLRRCICTCAGFHPSDRAIIEVVQIAWAPISPSTRRGTVEQDHHGAVEPNRKLSLEHEHCLEGLIVLELLQGREIAWVDRRLPLVEPCSHEVGVAPRDRDLQRLHFNRTRHDLHLELGNRPLADVNRRRVFVKPDASQREHVPPGGHVDERRPASFVSDTRAAQVRELNPHALHNTTPKRNDRNHDQRFPTRPPLYTSQGPFTEPQEQPGRYTNDPHGPHRPGLF